MNFKEVDKSVAEDILTRRRRSEISDMLDAFLKTNLQVAEIDEYDMERYESPKSVAQSIRAGIKNYNKKNKTFLSVAQHGDHVYLVNRSISE